MTGVGSLRFPQFSVKEGQEAGYGFRGILTFGPDGNHRSVDSIQTENAEDAFAIHFDICGMRQDTDVAPELVCLLHKERCGSSVKTNSVPERQGNLLRAHLLRLSASSIPPAYAVSRPRAAWSRMRWNSATVSLGSGGG